MTKVPIPIRRLALVLAVLATLVSLTISPANADTTTFTGTIPASTTASHSLQSGAGTVSATLTCTGSGSIAIRLYDGATMLTQNGGACPSTYTVTTTLATAKTIEVRLQGTPGLGYTVNVTHPAAGATTTTAAPTTTTTAAPTTTTTAPPATTTTTTASSANGTTYWSDGTRAPKSIEVGGTISAYATGALASRAYILATGTNGCTAEIRQSSGVVQSDASGNIPVTTDTVKEGPNPRPAGTYDACFVLASDLSRPTAPVTVNVGTATTTTTAAPTTTTTVAPTTTTTVAPTTTTTAPPAANVCNINPGQGEAAIMAAINACPDGTASAYTVVKFPANATYTTNNKIQVADRAYLNIDLNGSKITTTTNGTNTLSVNGVFVILRGHHIQLRNGTLTGDFTAYEGQPRSLGTIGVGDPEFTEAAMGVGLYGTDSATLEDLKLYNHWGDGVTTGPAHYVDWNHVGSDTFTNNVWMRRIEVETVGRMCFAPTSGNNIWIEDSQCRDAWYGGIDAEADNVDQPLRGHHYLRNTFDGYNHFGILIPVMTKNSGDYEIRDNTFLTPNDNITFTIIEVGMYPENPNRAQNVTITGNKVKFYCQAIAVDNTDGVTITGNTLTRLYKPLPDGTGYYTPDGVCNVGNTDPIQVTDSTNVVTSPNTIN